MKRLDKAAGVSAALAAALLAGCFAEDATGPDAAATATYAAVSVGTEHTCAIDTGGRALCWGANISGQLGVGDYDRRLVPAIVSGGTPFMAIAAGGSHTCAIATDGRAWCWGSALWGQVGNGLDGLSAPNRPQGVSGDRQFVQMAAGESHTCALEATGHAWCWGMNFDGRLGIGTGTTFYASQPASTQTNQSFTALTAGDRHTCALTAGGEAWCWGWGENGRLGNGGEEFVIVPTAIGASQTFTSITAGRAHTCGLTQAGEIYCWGAGGSGQIGDGAVEDRTVPTRIQSGQTFVAVAAGGDNTCAITIASTVHCWGRTQVGSIGDDPYETRLVPAVIPGSHTTFLEIQSGNREDGATSCGLDPDAVLYCWGWGRTGQIGNGDILDQPEPTRVAGQQ